MKKKIMLLGGNYYQMTLTKTAKDFGCQVISVDYLLNNLAYMSNESFPAERKWWIVA